MAARMPDLVMMMLVFFGGQTLLNTLADRSGWGDLTIDPFVAGALTIGFIFGAYMTEIFRGARRAARPARGGVAYGMSHRAGAAPRRQLQMLRHALAPLSNTWLVMLKSTAIVSLIGLSDPMQRAATPGSTRIFLFYAVAGLMYLVHERIGAGVRAAARAMPSASARSRSSVDWSAIRDSLPSFAAGAWVTFELTIAALAIGMAGALPLAVLRGWPSRWVSGPVWAFTYVIRGTPLLVQLYLVYYGLAQFDAVRDSVLWPWLGSAWFCAIAAFAINTCAYTIEILHGAMRAVPAGEIEAAKAMGMPRATLLRRVVLPAAMRRMLPAYGNEVIFMLQATSLASTVTLMDLTGAAREMNSRFYLPFEAFLSAALIYLAITMALVGLFHFAERRWLMPWQSRR